MNYTSQELLDKFTRLQAKYAQRDVRMFQIQKVREGKLHEIASQIFPDIGPWKEPITSNYIDIIARDAAEKIAPLPTFSCSTPNLITEKDRKKANLKTQIAVGYANMSNLQVQMFDGADSYVSYAFLPFKVEPDYDNDMPMIRVLSPIGAYPVFDRWGRLKEYFQKTWYHIDDVIAEYPEFYNVLSKKGSQYVELVFFHDKNWDIVFLSDSNPIVLSKVANPIGEVSVVVAKRPGVTDIPRGQFDDVLFAQAAKAKMALLALELADNAVNAPLALPSDVPDIPIGPGATIRSNNPEGIRRVPLDVPPAVFAEQQQLDNELRVGARYPEVRGGNLNASVVTGTGVQALMDGYDTQIRAHQAIFADAFQNVISLCFRMDEVLFAGVKKRMRAVVNGSPVDFTYESSSAIGGDYTVNVSYGLAAGLDVNRFLVLGLQMRAERVVSRDWLRNEVPIAIDSEDEARKVDVEDLEEAVKQSIMGYSQSVGEIVAQGGDPAEVLKNLRQILVDRKKGVSLTDSLAKLFPEQKPEPAAPTGVGEGVPGVPADMPISNSEGNPGQGGEGLPQMPDLQTLIAGLNSRGAPNLSATMKSVRAV